MDTIALGIENTVELLSIHDRDIGRHDAPSLRAAKGMEFEIEEFRAVFDMLAALVDKTP